MPEELSHQRVRQLWHLLEPLHAVLYYAPEAFEEAAALGYEGGGDRWPSYFAWRAAPLGPVGAAVVSAAFYGFSPAMVRRYVPAAWEVAEPAKVLAARERAVDRAYRSIFREDPDDPAAGPALDGPDLAEAARLTRRAAEAAHTAGRPLAAANAALPWPEAPHLQLWQAATILREHRGDGHLAALLTAELDAAESLVSFAAVGAASEETFASRGWSDAEWSAARTRLAARGLLTADGTATDAGRELRAEVERRTDELATAPWRAIGAEGAERLVELLGGPWVKVLGTGMLPAENTLGIGKG
ncbi:SCO6745 family protein [Streptomyces sp. MAR4 CNX-425]|uniref:SCO6745 family protein n=1 Tax=Streptomyces sp. MAR4 CNX-425 TaxID=3406343 RepID=UPI003B513E47